MLTIASKDTFSTAKSPGIVPIDVALREQLRATARGQFWCHDQIHARQSWTRQRGATPQSSSSYALNSRSSLTESHAKRQRFPGEKQKLRLNQKYRIGNAEDLLGVYYQNYGNENLWNSCGGEEEGS